MLFEADLVQDDKSKSLKKIKSKAFSLAKNFDGATHVKLKGVNQFKVIGEVKIRRKKDSEGNPANDFIESSDFTPVANEEYVCVIGEKEFPIEPQLYAQTVLMKKAEGNKGNFYRCDDGVYVHKDELQIPAYKKVETHKGAELKGPAYDGKCLYVEQEVLKLKKDGQTIVLTEEMKNDPALVKRNETNKDAWEYFVNGKWEECTHEQGVDTRLLIRQVMIGDKIVDVSHIKQDASGKLSVDIDGFGPIETEKTVDLKTPFIDIKQVDEEPIELRTDVLRITPRYVKNSSLTNKRYSWRENNPGPDGLLSINNEDDYLYCNYADGRRVYYFKCGYKLSDSQLSNIRNLPNVTIFRTKSIDFSRAASGMIEYKFDAVKEVEKYDLNKLEDLSYDGDSSQIDYYPVGDGNIDNLEWKKVEGVDQINSYRMNGVTFSNIVWEGGEIKSCKIEYTNDAGETVSEETSNIKATIFRNLAIKCTQIDKLEDVSVNEDGKVSFKLGNYEFKDANVDENGKIGKCKLKLGGGEFQEVDLATEPRFEQLRVSINTILADQEIVPLIQSKLVEKKDGKYERVADVVQTQPMYTEEEWASLSPEEKERLGGQYGVVSAKEIGSVNEAIDIQKQFRDNPFKTQVIDDKEKNKVHQINDVTTTYEGASEFEFDTDLIPDLIGKDKIEIKKGEIVIDPKRETDRVTNIVAFGFGMFGYLFPIGLAVAAPALMVGLISAIACPIRRAIKKHKLENLDIDKITRKMQKKAKVQCHKNINKYEKNYRKQLKIYRNRLSQDEYTIKAKQLREEFEFNCRKELGKLQVLGQGAMNCPFDLSKKTKLTRENILGFAAAKQKQRIIRDGFDRKQLRKTKKEYRHKLGFGFKKALKEENERRHDEHLPGISAEDFRKQLRRERDNKKVLKGGIKEKISALKHTPDYMAATRAEKRKMLEDAKAAAKKSLLTKVEQVQFNEMHDKKGNSIVLNETRDADAFVQSVVDQGDGYSKHTYFKSGFEYENYDEAKSFHSAVERKIYKDDERTCARDKKIGLEAVQKLKSEKVAQVEADFSQLTQNIEHGVQTDNYEELLRLQVTTNKIAKLQNEQCEEVARLTERIPYKELNEAKVAEVGQRIYDVQTGIRVNQRKVDDKKQGSQEAYKKQVVQWAKADYIKAHKGEFEEYCKANPNIDPKVATTSFMSYMQRTVGAKAVADEMAVHRAVNNVEDSIMAEVFCEQPHRKANYEAWVAEQNKAGANLDVNSEKARCSYYVHCEKQDVRAMNNFKISSKDAFEQKAQERIDAGTLVTSSTKQEKVDNMNKNIETVLEERKKANEKEQRKQERQAKRDEREQRREERRERRDARRSDASVAPPSAPAMTR